MSVAYSDFGLSWLRFDLGSQTLPYKSHDLWRVDFCMQYFLCNLNPKHRMYLCK